MEKTSWASCPYMESENIPCEKGRTGITDPAPGPAWTPQNPTLGIPGSAVPMLLELWQPWGRAHSLGSLGSAQHPLRGEPDRFLGEGV